MSNMVRLAYITQPGRPHTGIPFSLYESRNIAPGSTGAPYVTTRPPLLRMARGVRSSGSTLIPPVHMTISAPSAIICFMAAVIALSSSPGVEWAIMWQPYSPIFSSITGVNVSCIMPFSTSLPVVTTPYFLGFMGRRRSMGLSPAAAFARSIACFSITRGIILVPQSLSPAFTGKPEERVAIIIRPKEFTSLSFWISAMNSPSISAISSILPSLGSVGCIFSPIHISRSTSAASFSCRVFSSLSHT